jgi:hypothetical protein
MPYNKYRAAIEVLLQGRDQLVESLADDVLDQREILLEGGFQFHEFLESQGARLHFLGLLVGNLEQSAEMLEELAARKKRTAEGRSEDPDEPGPFPRKRPKSRGPRSAKPKRPSPPNSEGSMDETPF